MEFINIYEKGIDFNQFVKSADEGHKEKIINIKENIDISEALKKEIEGIDKKINILAFAEPWCIDCMINTTAMGYLSEINNNINVKILPREGYEDVLKDYAVNGKIKIPTMFFMDDMYKVLGDFVEKPKIVKNVEEKGNQVDIIVTKKKYRRGQLIENTILEIMEYFR